MPVWTKKNTESDETFITVQENSLSSSQTSPQGHKGEVMLIPAREHCNNTDPSVPDSQVQLKISRLIVRPLDDLDHDKEAAAH